MNTPLIINDYITIPAEQLEISAVRSSGPGGQNVNKVATCIELRFRPESCGQLSMPVVQRLLKIAGNRVDSENTIIITSQRYREQYRNLDDACQKLREMILKALKPPKVRRATRPTKASVENRINHKKQTSFKKSQRQKRDWDE
ncbi:MAG TPA: alternative ribosome rescue aminoacyl-tRNA hydrolase ArfB [Candidatus Ozemobacteraceae bacterium]|nr:alternative ribosome rescue aminoacyl-tRNA hydrolase ArfB [Candidatus Ozemobacteraceae bacterium]